MSEKLETNLKLEQQKDHEEDIEIIIAIIYIILQAVLLPTIYTKIAYLQQIKITEIVCLVGIFYYIINQVFFSYTKYVNATLVTIIFTIIWVVLLTVGGTVILHGKVISEELVNSQTFNVLKAGLLAIVVTFFLLCLNAYQEQLREETNNLGLVGYKSKQYQLWKQTKDFILIIAIFIILGVLISLALTQTIQTIDWKNLALKISILYGTIMFGTLIRRD